MGHNLFVLNMKQPADISEDALVSNAASFLTAQGFTGADTYWGRGKADWFEAGGTCRGVLQAAAAGVEDPELNNNVEDSAVFQYQGEPEVKALLETLCDNGDYHDIDNADEISWLEPGDWLVAIDYHH